MKQNARRRSFPWWPVIIATLLLLLTFGGAFVRLYTDWLWFRHDVGLPQVYTTVVQARVLVFFGAMLIAAAIAAVNWYPALKSTMIFGKPADTQMDLIIAHLLGWVQRSLGLLVTIASLVVGLLIGLLASAGWMDYLRFANAVTVGQRDPVFGADLGFYLFRLPFLQMVAGQLLFLMVIVWGVTAAIYYSNQAIGRLGSLRVVSPSAQRHLLILAAVFALVLAWNVWLVRYSVLYSRHVVFTGAGYTDLAIRLPALSVMVVGLIVVAALCLVNIRSGRAFVMPARAAMVWFGVAVIGFGILPAIVEQTVVVPNQLQREAPNILRNIQATREAFNLHKIEVRPVEAYQPEPTQADLRASRATLENMRIWDPRVLAESYNNLQALRLYYRFRPNGTSSVDDNGIDVGRYTVNGQTRVMMLAARELYSEGLPPAARSWQSTRLQYTHGYGVAMNQVNAATAEGGPKFIIQNIPPQAPANLRIVEPEIYYGEIDNSYVLANSRVQELNYPSGESGQPVYTRYRGRNGVPVGQGHLLNRMLFSLRFNDGNFMLSRDLTAGTRLLFNRQIMQRAQTIFPFLRFDPDPYIVVADGQLVWMMDAYTTTSRYPYSTAFSSGGERGINYIRNSVKVTIDAYDGSVRAYVTEPDDPLIQVYQRIFPRLFTPFEQMPESLKAHVRYPEQMFIVQAAMYRSYHITDARLFFQKEDVWDFPNENLSVQEKSQMRPYYVLMRLPDENRDAFMLTLPFTPLNRQNAIGWMAAHCDPEDYGKVVVYRFPDSVTVPGPETVYAFFQQDPEISPKMSLWNNAQGGSQALFGNMILKPIGKSLLYVQPVFLRASKEGGQAVPELTAVMVASGNRTAIADTFEAALNRLFAERDDREPTATTPGAGSAQPSGPPSRAALIEQANQAYDAAVAAQRRGDWAEYGRRMQTVERALRALRDSR